MTDRVRTSRSLRTELVIQLTILVTAALVLPTVLLVRPGALLAPDRRLSLQGDILADVTLFAAAPWFLLRRALVQPLRDLAGATARVGTAQRLPLGAAVVQEIQQVAA